MKVYLAGAIRDKNDDGRSWRENFEQFWGSEFTEVLNPLNIHSPEEIQEARESEYGLEASATAAGVENVVEDDKEMIDGCDVLYVHWEENVSHCGTPMEILYAHQQDTPVVTEYVGEDIGNSSIWLTVHSDYISRSQTNCIGWIFDNVEE